jgi:prepilin-type N-terminal cleavage/methylation domain-containing protein
MKRNPRGPHAGFTLLEVVLSMGIVALLAASVYAIVSSTLGASRAAVEMQFGTRRLDAFRTTVRDTLLNLPAQGSVALEIGMGQTGDPESRLLLDRVQGVFGMPSLAGGTAVLAAKARSDGTRTITLYRIPARANAQDRENIMRSRGVPLLPGVIKPRWTFYQNGAWHEEYPPGSPRPLLVRLEGELKGQPDPFDAVFYVPPVTAASASPSPTPPSP